MIRTALLFSLWSTVVAISPPWRTSMDNCWTNVTCDRALIVSHGGQWNLSFPYDSLPAFQTAYLSGSDAVKGDFRVSKDGVGMVMHSSPIEIYESIPCAGKRVEDTLAADLEKCTMALTNLTFISAPEMLAWAHEKVIVMLCVKESGDIARAITTLIENNATDRAFLEVHVADLVNLVPTLPGWQQVYFLADASSPADINATLAAPTLSRIFTFEFEPDFYASANWTSTIDDVLHPAGLRSLTATSKFEPPVGEQEELFRQGIDVVYTYGTPNGVTARTIIDIERGVSPPISP
jgi:hypothetical protein